MIYELEVVYYGPDLYNQSVISSLTGLNFDEADQAVKSVRRKSWSGQAYVKLFQNLGFNTNPRFVKFEPNTPYPCIMRCRNDKKGYWYLFLYHDGVIYDMHGNSFRLDDPFNIVFCNGSYFLKLYGMKVTSMLQVWI
ncbi:hypothetical protein ORI89_17375 [Sphingobacterium sp. UT-1RO-CII-1]|uniref:hypothetical protein n=1 Tax=Sphingobacterium sp. UT-1RO-CII-1 TaxID=2995225 RepID=UPI00227B53E9|nr:hypothetical protein [Sphingobacterium sp. UT-1RO-CII-1]MCY4781434.1 hypothetical protein [Sphingobacterium sp. UT-1RO-CII-1]